MVLTSRVRKVKEGVDQTETRTDADDRKPELPKGAYFVLGPFGPMSRVLVWCAVGIGLAEGLGCLLALCSIAGSISRGVAYLEQIQRLLGK